MLYGFFLAWLWLFVIIITIITPQHVRFSSMYLYAIAWNLDVIPSIVIVRDLFFGGCLCLDLANVADWDDPPRIMHFGFRFDEACHSFKIF